MTPAWRTPSDAEREVAEEFTRNRAILPAYLRDFANEVRQHVVEQGRTSDGISRSMLTIVAIRKPRLFPAVATLAAQELARLSDAPAAGPQ